MSPRPVHRSPIVTIDVVVFRMADSPTSGHRLEVLAVERRREPFVGRRALPGAYVAAGETLIEACWRCLTSKAGLARAIRDGLVGEPRQFLAADSVARDPRGHAVSIVHMVLVDPRARTVGGEQPDWLVVGRTDDLAFDHSTVVDAARRFLVDRLWADATAFTRLAGSRDLTTPLMRAIAEAAAGHSLDHANFSRRLTGSGLFAAAGDGVPASASRRQRGPGRPPTVWVPSTLPTEEHQ